MVNLKLPDDGFDRNPCHAFLAIGTPSESMMNKTFAFFDKYNENYDWKDHPTPKIFRNVLVTPVGLSKNRSLLKHLRELKKQGYVDNVMFDSGGFQVLTGSLKSRGISTLEDLQKLNQEIYNEEDWADIYIMPDHPSSKDDMKQSLDPTYNSFKSKQEGTVEATLNFFECLSPTVQGKVAPVFHVRNQEDIEYFFEAYKPVLDKSKFASYSASSLTKEGAARQLSLEVLTVLDLLLKKLKSENIGLHCLGLAAPSAVFCMNYMGVTALDASTPIIGAGLGKVYFPYYGACSCSEQRDGEAANLTQETLDFYRKNSNHFCPFCENISTLKMGRCPNEEELPGYMFRRLHNLIVLDEFNWHYKDLNLEKLKVTAPLMHRNFTSVLNLTDQLSFL